MLKQSKIEAVKVSSAAKLVNKISTDIESELLTFPNQPIIWSIISGPNKGQIYELSGGKAVIIIGNFAKPLIFIAGKLNKETFYIALDLCPDDAFIYCQPLYHHFFIGAGWQILSKVQLVYCNPSPIALRQNLFIVPIDNIELFKKCSWFEKVGQLCYGITQNFLTHGEGYALCNSNEILAEVYSMFVGKNHVEIGIVTNPDFRQQGLAAQVSSYYIEKLHKEGKIPIWSCRTDNLGSLKTALKIGFEIQKYYVQLVKS